MKYLKQDVCLPHKNSDRWSRYLRENTPVQIVDHRTISDGERELIVDDMSALLSDSPVGDVGRKTMRRP